MVTSEWDGDSYLEVCRGSGHDVGLVSSIKLPICTVDDTRPGEYSLQQQQQKGPLTSTWTAANHYKKYAPEAQADAFQER